VVFFGSAFFTVLEGLFLIGRRIHPVKLEYDDDNLYITDSEGERPVALSSIVSIRLVYGRTIFDNARMSLGRYVISFGDPANPQQVGYTVFNKMARVFADFCDGAKEKNPDVEIKNWATNWDGPIARLFNSRNS
jgi:hypothetical protein